jgi:16S rRNA (uracil1498-N3)-methyltransferase
MTLRLFVGNDSTVLLARGAVLSLPPAAARHAQVRRVQPGDAVTLFDGQGCDWPSAVLAVGRSTVEVRVGASVAVANELPCAVTLALAMPANERMDALVEQATQLGVARVQPLLATRSVLRLSGTRAERKRAHWRAVAESACEQCGRAVVPVIEPVRELNEWLADLPAGQRWLLSLAVGAQRPTRPPDDAAMVTLSGPEGGLTVAEEAAARDAGFVPIGLGPRVLRADAAPLALLAWLGLQWPAR